MMSCTGNSNVDTPALDSIAKNGIRFERATCTNPVCVPSRFSLFTGLMPSEIGMRCNEDAQIIPNVSNEVLNNGMGYVLQRAGYETYYGGKEHLPTFRSKDIGFEYFCRDERDTLAAESAQFLLKKHKKPFLLVVSFINPHDICHMAINDHREKTRGKAAEFLTNTMHRLGLRRTRIEIRNVMNLLSKSETSRLPKLPENHEPQEREPEAIRSLFKREFRGAARKKWDEKTWRQHRYLYARLTEKVDAQIGQVLDALENGPNSENTFVIFTSDHGDHDGSHKLEHKTAVYKESVEIPLLIKWNGAKTVGKVIKEMVSNGLDLFPTVCDLAGAEMPAGRLGKSLVHLIQQHDDNPSKNKRKWFPIECEIGRGVWSNDWAYILYDKGTNREQLYDLKSDPGQTRNHADDHPDMIKKCRKQYETFFS